MDRVEAVIRRLGEEGIETLTTKELRILPRSLLLYILTASWIISGTTYLRNGKMTRNLSRNGDFLTSMKTLLIINFIIFIFVLCYEILKLFYCYK